jgi:predicted transcriptional regulator
MKVVICGRVDPTIKNKISALAQEQERTLSDILERILKKFFQEQTN